MIPSPSLLSFHIRQSPWQHPYTRVRHLQSAPVFLAMISPSRLLLLFGQQRRTRQYSHKTARRTTLDASLASDSPKRANISRTKYCLPWVACAYSAIGSSASRLTKAGGRWRETQAAAGRKRGLDNPMDCLPCFHFLRTTREPVLRIPPPLWIVFKPCQLDPPQQFVLRRSPTSTCSQVPPLRPSHQHEFVRHQPAVLHGLRL